ncbi:TetR/AcrR family transcriptional regulator [Sphingomonas flavalba]|uniref:TetR/AcrR family transcriptional regulator n=1 Tax=Sphingomonas flavalba TaxID=2559804 RepID=UPI00109E1338|nr:TetR/AcrR family transcriptional regulator [Sphingomonas flavalba]
MDGEDKAVGDRDADALARDRYHHGDLHAALIRATEEIIAERGVEGFSLREAARRAGVSAAAPAHHFGDARGLLTAVAVHAFNALADVTRAATAGIADPVEKRLAMGQAYIRYALTQRARFDLMFRKNLLDRDDPALKEAGERCFAVVVEAIGGDPETDPRTEARVIACWALAHGLARLKLDGALIENGDPDFVPMVLKTLSV